MSDNDVAQPGSNAAAAVAVAPPLPPLSRRTPLCSYAPPSLAGAPTALLRTGKTLLDVASERIGDWGSGFGGFLVAVDDGDNDDDGDGENERRRRRATTATSSSSSSSSCCCDIFGSGLVLPTATRQATHELAGKGKRASLAARDAVFYREYATFLAEVKATTRWGGAPALASTAAENAAAALSSSASAALLTRESVVAGKRVPLAKLFRVVQRLGGHAKVAEGKAWRDVLRAFEIEETKNGNATYSLRQVWMRASLSEFEKWRAEREEEAEAIAAAAAAAAEEEAEDDSNRLFESMLAAVEVARKREGRGKNGGGGAAEMEEDDDGGEEEADEEEKTAAKKKSPPPPPPLPPTNSTSTSNGNGTRSSRRRKSLHLSSPAAVAAAAAASILASSSTSARRGGRGAGGSSSDLASSSKRPRRPPPRARIDAAADILCAACRSGHAESAVVLCDGCDEKGAHHLFCLSPPLARVPEGEWLCPRCREKGEKERELLTANGENKTCSSSSPGTALPPPTPPMTLADFAEASVSARERALGLFSSCCKSSNCSDGDGEGGGEGGGAAAAGVVAGTNDDGNDKRQASSAAAAALAATPREVEALFWETVESGDRPVDVLSAFGCAVSPPPPPLSSPSLSSRLAGDPRNLLRYHRRRKGGEPSDPLSLPPSHAPRLDVGMTFTALPWRFPPGGGEEEGEGEGEGDEEEENDDDDNHAAATATATAALGDSPSPVVSVSTLWLDHLHCGAPRRWYVVPATHRREFEEAVAAEAEALARDEQEEEEEEEKKNADGEKKPPPPPPPPSSASPLLISPRTLQGYDIPVYSITQQPGQTVVIAPGCAFACLWTGLAASEAAAAAVVVERNRPRERVGGRSRSLLRQGLAVVDGDADVDVEMDPAARPASCSEEEDEEDEEEDDEEEEECRRRQCSPPRPTPPTAPCAPPPSAPPPSSLPLAPTIDVDALLAEAAADVGAPRTLAEAAARALERRRGLLLRRAARAREEEEKESGRQAAAAAADVAARRRRRSNRRRSSVRRKDEQQEQQQQQQKGVDETEGDGDDLSPTRRASDGDREGDDSKTSNGTRTATTPARSAPNLPPPPPVSPAPLVSPRATLRLRQQQQQQQQQQQLSTSEEEEERKDLPPSVAAAAAAAASTPQQQQKRSPSRRASAATASKRIAALSKEGKTISSPAWFCPSLSPEGKGKRGSENDDDGGGDEDGEDVVDEDVLSALAALSCVPEEKRGNGRTSGRAVRTRRG